MNPRFAADLVAASRTAATVVAANLRSIVAVLVFLV
jgi:hypothetical protein